MRSGLARRAGGALFCAQMNIHVLPAGPIQTNAYLLTVPERGVAVLIDAPLDVWPEVAALLQADGCVLKELWLTHGHWDHMQGAAEVVRQTGAEVLAHRDDQILIETPEVMSVVLGFPIEAARVDRWIAAGDKLDVLGDGLVAEVRHVPGHCPGNVLFYFATKGMALVGDAIFAGSVGRTDLPQGNFPTLEKAIRTQIYTLPKETKLFPGHGEDTAVGEEMASNPYVRP